MFIPNISSMLFSSPLENSKSDLLIISSFTLFPTRFLQAFIIYYFDDILWDADVDIFHYNVH